MKKSKAFYWAQIAVLRCEELSYEEKLEIVAVLINERERAKRIEKFREMKNETV